MTQGDCDDCGSSFSLRTGDGSCAKCDKLKPHAIGSSEYIDISNWQQCSLCGVTRRNNMPVPDQGEPQTCGSEVCIKKAQGPGYQPRPAQPNIAETHLERASAVAKRFGLGPTMSKNPAAGTSLNTAALLHHEHGGGTPGEDKVLVCWAVRESKAPKSLNLDLGSSSKKWAVSVALPDIRAHLVEVVNLEWARSCTTPLLTAEVTIRWTGSLLLEPNTSNMLLGQFYAYYSVPSRSSIYFTTIPLMWKSACKATKGLAIWIELYIDSLAVNKRIDALSQTPTSSMNSIIGSAFQSTVRKRALSSTSEGTNRDDRATKRSNVPGPSQSMFVPSDNTTQVHQRSSVTLKKIICVTDATTGEVEFEETSVQISGGIRSNHFSKGAMKYAFDVSLFTFPHSISSDPAVHQFKTTSGEALVVKRFYRISETNENSMAPPVTVLDNRTQIYLELQRLGIAAYFLKQFFRYAKRCAVPVHSAIVFADAWLGQELNRPSQASGTSKIDASHEGITWLVESKRATMVEHYTFTLNHQSLRQDLCAQTIHAFAHFVYGHSNKAMVIADIQGTLSNVDGRDILVLFDPMTHTPAGQVTCLTRSHSILTHFQ
ncbi:kinase-like domain-containing protein [Mycena galericulata]|nr:kinase-like domain-containing protein [Mycena galericulata]